MREVRQAQEGLLHDADVRVPFDTVEREILLVGWARRRGEGESLPWAEEALGSR